MTLDKLAKLLMTISIMLNYVIGRNIDNPDVSASPDDGPPQTPLTFVDNIVDEEAMTDASELLFGDGMLKTEGILIIYIIIIHCV